MRGFLFALVSFIGLAMAAPAGAYENFIPLGTGYSTDTDSLPAFDSDKDRINLQADIYETEIYNSHRSAVERGSYLRRFSSDPESTGADYSIDY